MSENMFDPVLDAGLTQGEFAKIANVCRATAMFWLNGDKQPSHLHKDHIVALVKKIESLVELKQLPLSPRLRRKQRLPELRRLILDDVTK